MDVIIVPCTQEKVWDTQPAAGAVAARDAYNKPAFYAWRQYAESSGGPWFILSTRYGLLRPEQPIQQYNAPVSAVTSRPDFLAMLRRQGQELNLGQFDRVVLLDWQRFEPLVKAAIGDFKVPYVLQRLRY